MIPGDTPIGDFRVGGHEFAFEILQVERILRYEPPVPLPKAPPFLEGIAAFDGGAVGVIDLRKRFEVPAAIGEETRIMILRLEEERVGLVVDEVREVRRIDRAAIAAPGATVRGLAAPYIAGIVTASDRAVILLNAGKVLTSTERLALAAAGVPAHD